MTPDLFQRLSPRQAECLRLVARDRGAKEIGLLLGISDETVEAHIKAALKRLGSNSRFTAARALAEFEGRTHPVGIPTEGAKPVPTAPASDNPSYQLPRTERRGNVLHDATVPHDAVAPVPDRATAAPAFERETEGARRDALSPLHRIALAAVIAAAIVIVVAAARPLAEGFQALANLMQPRH
jgi:DNA-binding CsgD family transcriptional regulator